jgi:hypothetical protein
LQVRKYKSQKSAFSSVVRTKEKFMRLSPEFERICHGIAEAVIGHVVAI